MSIKRVFKIARRGGIKAAVVAGLVMASAALIPAASALAGSGPEYGPLNAHGCTSVSVGEQCITVNGSGVHVNYVDNLHNTGTLNKCDLYANFLYEQGGVPDYVSAHYPLCYGPGYYVRWNANQNFDSGSQMCATTKDSLTGGLYNNPACETIG